MSSGGQPVRAMGQGYYSSGKLVEDRPPGPLNQLSHLPLSKKLGIVDDLGRNASAVGGWVGVHGAGNTLELRREYEENRCVTYHKV